jgi:hypothetical protein
MWEDVGVIQSCMGLEWAVLVLSAMLDEVGRLWEEAVYGSGGGGHSIGGGREVAALCDAACASLAVAGCHRPSNGGIMQTMGKWK